jgi:hypothetical protein
MSINCSLATRATAPLPPLQFSSLPSEMLLKILSFATPATLGSVSLSCKDLRPFAIESANQRVVNDLKIFISKLIDKLNSLGPDRFAYQIYQLSQIRDEIRHQDNINALKTHVLTLQNQIANFLTSISQATLDSLWTIELPQELMEDLHPYTNCLKKIRRLQVEPWPSDRLRKLYEAVLDLSSVHISDPKTKEKLYSQLFQSELASTDKWVRFYTLQALKNKLSKTERKNINQSIFKLGDVEEQARVHHLAKWLFRALATIVLIGTIVGITYGGKYDFKFGLFLGLFSLCVFCPTILFGLRLACYSRVPIMDPYSEFGI